MKRQKPLKSGIVFGGLVILAACSNDNEGFSSALSATRSSTVTDAVIRLTDTPTPSPTDTPDMALPTDTATPTASATTLRPTRESNPTPPDIPFECEFRTSFQCQGGANDGEQCRPEAPDPGCGGSPCVESEFFCKGGDRDGMTCDRAAPNDCPGGRCSNSELQICTSLACPIISRRNTGGLITGECAADGSSCNAVLQFFDPVDIPGIGLICVRAVPPEELACPAGRINCTDAPGPGLDYDLIQDHTILDDDGLGSCGHPGTPDTVGNSECEARCRNYCEGLGRQMSDFGCTGYCKSGSKKDQECVCDSFTSTCGGPNCADPNPSLSGSCNGKDNLQDPNVCGCQCLETGGEPSRPGALNFQVGAQIIVETRPPCGEGSVLLRLPPQCIPLTTERATGILIDANNVATCRPEVGQSSTCNQIPNNNMVGVGLSRIGSPEPGGSGSCEAVLSNGLSGFNIVGNISFFDSTIGDLETELDWFCR